MTDLPVAVRQVEGTWRAYPVGDQPSAHLLAFLGSGADALPGFRVTRWQSRPVRPVERHIDVDQTNDSWVVGDEVVVKWATQPLVGPHPAPERLRRLAAAGFAATPRPWGMVEWRTPEGHWVPVATAVDLVHDATDGWTWCLHEARVSLGLRDGQPRAFARRLGAVTAEMHRATADSPTGPVADHGDFHVGQVLRPPTGELYVIDFDGNPTLPPAERVQHRPAAYDVAGMLLSLENVGHVVRHYDEIRDDAVVDWTVQVQDAFLVAYREGAGDLLDPSLLEPYVLDGIQRELAYAEAHLPRWRYVPEAALLRRGLR